MNGNSDTRLLSNLATPDRGAAWQAFLRRYSSLILHIVRRHEADENRVMDGYLFVCDKLSESDFRRLRKFQSNGSATFTTWLTTVTRNLCIDWHRNMHGRKRPSAVTSRLSDLESFVFRELYEGGRTKAECLNSLPEEYSHVTAQDLDAINARIHNLLTPSRRWRLIHRNPTIVPLDNVRAIDTDDGPHTQALSAEQTASLERAIAALDVDERLAIRLRFQEDLSLDQIAQIIGVTGRYRVRLLINGALGKIRETLTD